MFISAKQLVFSLPKLVSYGRRKKTQMEKQVICFAAVNFSIISISSATKWHALKLRVIWL